MARIPASRLDHALDGHGLQVTWKGWFLTPASLPSMTTRPEGASPVPVTLYHCPLVRVPRGTLQGLHLSCISPPLVICTL